MQEVVPALFMEIVIFILEEKSHFGHLSDLVVRRQKRDGIGELVLDPTGCSEFAKAMRNISTAIPARLCTLPKFFL